MNQVVALGRWTVDATSNKRLIGNSCLVVAWCWVAGYVVAASVYFFRRSLLIDAVSSLRIVEPERVAAHEANLIIAMNVMFLIGIGTIALERYLCLHGLTGFFRKSRRLFANEPRLYGLSVWVSALLCAALVPLFFLRGKLMIGVLFSEDGPVEWFTAIGFLAAAGMGAWTFRRVARLGADRRLKTWIFLFALGCFVIGMEEISWGQRVVGWATPEMLDKVNTQHEANLHNIFTDYFNSVYFWGGLGFFALFAISTVLQVRNRDQAWSAWLPHYALLPVTALIAGFSFHLEANELIEPIAATWVGLYAWQLFWATAPMHRRENMA